MLSLFADQEREAKLDSLGDPLALLKTSVSWPRRSTAGFLARVAPKAVGLRTRQSS